MGMIVAPGKGDPVVTVVTGLVALVTVGGFLALVAGPPEDPAADGSNMLSQADTNDAPFQEEQALSVPDPQSDDRDDDDDEAEDKGKGNGKAHGKERDDDDDGD